ncbi:hypothetical protein ABIA00_001568 [Bradyrhizobium ottawaense]
MHAPAGAMEKADAKPLLEASHGMAESRGGDTPDRRGATEAACAYNRQESFQLNKVGSVTHIEIDAYGSTVSQFAFNNPTFGDRPDLAVRPSSTKARSEKRVGLQ